MESVNFLDEHLNVGWLRPESALCDAIASSVISRFEFTSPSLDLGSGNGIFSFITAGGDFSREFDWYRNVSTEGFWENKDIYDAFSQPVKKNWIARSPRYQIDCAFDAKENLLSQAQGLGLYGSVRSGDAKASLPFGDASFQTVFSNILCWLDSAEGSLREIGRILRPGGRALLCMQDPKFKEYCISYQWRERNSETLRLLNRGRSDTCGWTITYSDLEALSRKCGFHTVFHSYYLSPLTMKIWDIGLRPLSPVLLRMVAKLNEEDRLSIKEEWMDILRPFMVELYMLDRTNGDQGGFHFICLEKK